MGKTFCIHQQAFFLFNDTKAQLDPMLANFDISITQKIRHTHTHTTTANTPLYQ